MHVCTSKSEIIETLNGNCYATLQHISSSTSTIELQSIIVFSSCSVTKSFIELAAAHLHVDKCSEKSNSYSQCHSLALRLRFHSPAKMSEFEKHLL